jgi:transcription elongation factor Elf1
METVIDFYSDVCCEWCGEVIHNHFDCPVCKRKYASTSIYGASWDENIFHCEECGSEFKRIKEDIWEFNNENSRT